MFVLSGSASANNICTSTGDFLVFHFVSELCIVLFAIAEKKSILDVITVAA